MRTPYTGSRLVVLFVAALLAACGGSSGPSDPAASPAASGPAASTRHVVVNGVELVTAALVELDGAARVTVPDGDYWYDARSGACGSRGGPTAAFLPAQLAFASALRADASGGGTGATTGVFVNGRELHRADVQALARLGQIMPGRYWLDASGFWGYEGLDIPIGNLMQGGSGGGEPGYNRSTAGGHLMGDGQSAGWFDPKTGASVLVGG